MPMEVRQFLVIPSSHPAKPLLELPREDRPVAVVLDSLNRHPDLHTPPTLRDPFTRSGRGNCHAW